MSRTSTQPSRKPSRWEPPSCAPRPRSRPAGSALSPIPRALPLLSGSRRVISKEENMEEASKQGPPKIQPRSLADYLEVMSKAVFQTGMSWKIVGAKWPGIKEAFRGFDPEAVAHLTPDEVDSLTNDPRLIR